MSSIQTITPESLSKLIQSKPDLAVIDVRTPAEFREIHVSFAKLAPLDSLNPKQIVADLGAKSSDAIYVFCRTGGRAKMAADKLAAQTSNAVNVVEGGVLAWEAAGLPVIRGAKTISLERQVRITAGSLVVIGVVLGFLVHPALFGLSAFVGAGLVFAGVTDTCGMGMLLARMPWNQVAGK